MSVSTPVVPVFPLPRYLLFPGAASPLRVFEPRYRQMVEDLLDGPGRLVMATLDPHSPQGEGPPPLLPIGTLAEIVKHRRIPNGEYLMWVVGLSRVRLDEVESPAPYRLTRVRLLEDLPIAGERALTLSSSLATAITDRGGPEVQIPDDAPVGLLADILVQCVSIDDEDRLAFFAELDPARRAEWALELHRANA